MYRHISTTYNQLSARVDSTSASPQINFLVVVHESMQDFPREANFLGGWASGVAKRLLGGSRACFPAFEWVNLVRFGAYFH